MEIDEQKSYKAMAFTALGVIAFAGDEGVSVGGVSFVIKFPCGGELCVHAGPEISAAAELAPARTKDDNCAVSVGTGPCQDSRCEGCRLAFLISALPGHFFERGIEALAMDVLEQMDARERASRC